MTCLGDHLGFRTNRTSAKSCSGSGDSATALVSFDEGIL
ncbi:hypothetical protein FRUB_04093 [Fimbriiglobus ruber]|uniref:Uncharacterized protein n=1 Tax=Fimbriiglobus ruber TaxID=1908690 RepID=A0A225E041_9BACT|nr:hypothetical protein FRUB_04093 [Fimbriiglobus ruber]